MSTGSFAWAIAVFISTPWQPSSIATAASLAVPTPASTMTGTGACSRMISRVRGVRIPRAQPRLLQRLLVGGVQGLRIADDLELDHVRDAELAREAERAHGFVGRM